MNKLHLYRLATAAMTVASLSACSDSNSDDSPTPAPVVNHVTMTFTAGQGTRAAFINEGGETQNNIVWESGEKLRVFPDYLDEDDYGNNIKVKSIIELKSASGQTSGTFTGEVAADQSYYAAIYPNQTTASLSETTLSSTDATINHISVSSVQNATEGTFDPSAGVMVSTTTAEQKNFQFRNLCAFLRIVPRYDCNTITVQSKNANEYLSGSVTAIYSGDELTWTEEQISKTTTVAASNKVTLVGNMIAGKAYYIAVLPNTLANGFSVTLEDCDNKITRYVNAKVTLERNYYYDISGAFLGSSTSGTPISRPTFVDLGCSVLWATCNLGATNDYESGSYYAWGEIAAMGEADPTNVVNKEIYNTDIKCSYDWESYKWGEGTNITSYTSQHLTKYTNTNTDKNTTLETADDAAAAASSKFSSCSTGTYRMPTKEEFEELMSKCYWEFSNNTYHSGVVGYIVYKRKAEDNTEKVIGNYNVNSSEVTYTTDDTHIFLPCSGFLNETSTQNEGVHGYYWSSTLYDKKDKEDNIDPKYGYKAYSLLISNVNQQGETPTYKAELHGDFRRGGQCIRPVKAKQ